MDHLPAILIYDNERDIRDFLAPLLREEGYPLDTAASHGEALALIAAGRYGLLIADAPKRDTARRWAALDALHAAAGATPIVICSAYDPATFKESSARGFAAVLPKPFSVEQMLAMVARYCASAAVI